MTRHTLRTLFVTLSRPFAEAARAEFGGQHEATREDANGGHHRHYVGDDGNQLGSDAGVRAGGAATEVPCREAGREAIAEACAVPVPEVPSEVVRYVRRGCCYRPAPEGWAGVAYRRVGVGQYELIEAGL